MSTTGLGPASRGILSHLTDLPTIPNAVTILRALATVYALAHARDVTVVFWATCFAAVTDKIDGWLAKMLNQSTVIGARLDQWEDWLLGVTLIIAITLHEGFTAYNTLFALCMIAYLAVRLLNATATTLWHSKYRTGMQFAGGVTILGNHAFEFAWAWYVGYGLLYASLPLLWFAARDHFPHWWRSQ